MESSKPIVYFFGCLRNATPHDTEAGHYLRSSDGSQTRNLTHPFGRYPDGTLCPEGAQAQGAAVLHQKDGWTAIGFWDRTGDERGNSNSNFIVQGTFTFEEMCSMAQEAYPALWKRFAPIRHAGTNCPDIQGFVIKSVDAEHVEIKLHGHGIAIVSLSDGWDDFAAAENLVRNIGAILNIPVKKA